MHFCLSQFWVLSLLEKNSVTWINIYCILLIVAFAVQLLVATVGFNLKSESVKGTLDNLMNEFESIDRSTLTMNFIQKSFQCCGVESPKDWKKHLNYYSNKFYYNDCDGSIKQLLMLRTPQSCCTSGSGYQNLRCNNYFQNGCLGKLSELIGQLILTLKTLAVVLGLFQIIGIIVSAFMIVKRIRTMKLYNGIYDVHT